MPDILYFIALSKFMFLSVTFLKNVIFLDFRFFFSIFAWLINKFLTISYCLFKMLVYICTSIFVLTKSDPILRTSQPGTSTSNFPISKHLYKQKFNLKNILFKF